MSREDFIAVGSRLFAVFLIVTTVRWFPSTLPWLSLYPEYELDKGLLSVVVLIALGGLAVGLVLWFFPLTIARKLLPAMSEPRSETHISPSIAISIGLVLLGFWVLTIVVPDLFYWATLIIRIANSPHSYEWSSEQYASMAATIAQLAVAAWLIFGTSGIKRIIYTFRYGTSKDAI